MSNASRIEILQSSIHELYLSGSREATEPNLSLFEEFILALECGAIRSAERAPDGNWSANPWVKEGILVGFRLGKIVDQNSGALDFSDRDTYLPRPVSWSERSVRVVPGGSSIRRGAFIAAGVTCMPPMYVNVGAWVDEGTMVDSHALVGSCAQIGKHVHLSAAAQIGGVIEPIGSRPVVVEDDVMVGGGVGIYEGIVVRKRAVIGAGVVLTASTPVYDLVNERVLRSTPTAPLEIPESAVVISGSRAISGEFASQHGLHASCALIVKYRDERTDAKTALEVELRWK